MNIMKTYREIKLRNQQRHLDKKYAEDGLTDEILAEQIRLNEYRHKHDINETDTEFVQ